MIFEAGGAWGVGLGHTFGADALKVFSASGGKCRIDVLYILQHKKSNAPSTCYHRRKTLRLGREFFVLTTTAIAALTPTRLKNISSVRTRCMVLSPLPMRRHKKVLTFL